MATHVVLFTRDLRVDDHPALHTAVSSADQVVPLFVLDDAIRGSSFAAPNRCQSLLDSLADLRGALAGSVGTWSCDGAMPPTRSARSWPKGYPRSSTTPRHAPGSGRPGAPPEILLGMSAASEHVGLQPDSGRGNVEGADRR